MILLKIIKSVLPKKVLTNISCVLQKMRGYSQRVYAQEGEDVVLARYLHSRENGFYIDVGAHHPQRFSNTYLFYKRGWRGINIDAMPGSMRAFNKKRPRDINIEIPISQTPELLTYYIFNEPALNGFSEYLSNSRNNLSDCKIIDKIKIKTSRLDDVLDEYLPVGQLIDFMTIDVEGLDFEVIQSNNWQKYRPHFVLVETLKSSVNDILASELVKYMVEMNYEVVAKTYNTTFFRNLL